MKIYGITGLIGSGKGTLADFLIEKHGFRKMSFADTLKDACSVIFGWKREMLEGDTAESRSWREKVDPFWSDRLGIENFSPRLALQWMGTEAGRGVFGDEIWTTCMERRINDFRESIEEKPYFSEEAKVVIPDTRFFNEIQLIKRLGGQIVRVQRGDLPAHWEKTVQFNMWKNGLSDRFDEQEMLDHQEWLEANIHASEREWIGVDIPNHVVFNNSTLEMLETAADQLSKIQ